MCEQLAESLKSGDYDVVICSAFHDASPEVADQTQVAILSKHKAYFTWSEAWQSPKQEPLTRGMAFAAIQTGAKRLGFFTALLSNQGPLDTPQKQALGLIDSVGGWETNQVQAFVIAASFDPSEQRAPKAFRRAATTFDRTGFVDATEEFPNEAKRTVRANINPDGGIADGVFVGPGAFPSHGRISATPFFDHYPTTSELQLNPDKVSLARDLRDEERRARRARTELSERKSAYWTGGILGFCVAMGIIIRFTQKRRALASVKSTAISPSRVPPKVSPPPLKPIIFVDSRARPAVSNPPQATLRARPVLRLQSPPKSKQAPTPPEAAEPKQPMIGPKRITEHDMASPSVTLSREPGVRQGVIKEISGWLKHKLVRKLVTDRAQLMEAQHLATRMANTLDNRLARIEAQIQQQNQAYVRRIEELNQELSAAREENRELIRERIAQVKAEMEAARARVLAEADLDNSSLRL